MVEIAQMVALMVPILIRVLIQAAILVKTKTMMRRSHANPIPYKYSVKASWLLLTLMKENKKDSSSSWKFTQRILSADLA